MAQSIGTSSLSLGGVSNSHQDIFSIYNNPALLDYSKTSGVSVFYNLPFGINELSQMSFCAKLPNKYASFGIGITHSGTELLNSQNIIISAGRKTEDFSFGLSTEIRQVSVFENGNYMGVLFNLGASSTILPKLEFSMHITNLNQAGIGLDKKEIFDNPILISGKYQASDKLFFYNELGIQLDQRISLKNGLEYFILENMTLRTGLNSNPINPAFGISLKKHNWCFNQSIDYDQMMGFSHSLSIVYDMAK